MTGRLETAIKARDKANREVQEYESKARTAMSRGDEATARVYAEKRQDSILVAKQYADTVNQLTPAVAQARDIFTQREKELKDIRAKKNLVVEQLKTNRDVEAAYDDLDELRRDSASKRLLDAVDEEVKAGSERAVAPALCMRPSSIPVSPVPMKRAMTTLLMIFSIPCAVQFRYPVALNVPLLNLSPLNRKKNTKEIHNETLSFDPCS